MPIYYGNKMQQPQQPGGQSPQSPGLGLWDYIKATMSVNSAALGGNTPGHSSIQPATPWQQHVPKGYGQAGSALGIPQPGSLEEILAHLDELQNPDRFRPNMDMLQSQAREMANAQYDPVIARIRNQMGAAQTRAGRNKDALGQMFSQLSGNLAGDIPKINQQFQGAEQQSADQYAGLKQGISDQYSSAQADQEAMMQRLNIQAAAPDALKQQQTDNNYFQNVASHDAQIQQDALSQEQQGAVQYTRAGSQNAQVEGTNRQADLMYQLQDLLAQYEGQIGEAETGKNSTYLSNLYGLENDASKNAMDQAQREFENYIKVINLGQSLQKNGQASGGPVQSPADVGRRVLSIGVSPDSAQQIQSVFMSAISSDPMIQAGIDSNFGQALPKEALANRVVEYGRQQGLSGEDLNALQVAALEYFGRR